MVTSIYNSYLLIVSSLKLLSFVTLIPKFMNFATFFQDLLAVLLL